MLIDTHCHLDDPTFSDSLDEVLDRSRRAGVGRLVVPGVAPAGWAGVAALAAKTPEVFPAFGLHPQHEQLFSDELGGRLEGFLRQGVATGEIGLDYTLQVARDVQMVAFREQARLSVSLGLPVLLHCRKAFEDLLRVLKEEGVERVGGVMHAFSGSVEVARQCLRLGLFISIAGAVTYVNAVKAPNVVQALPLDHLLLESDAPDMAPEPYRGRTNEPSFLVETARKVAELKGIPLAELAMQSTANAERLFRQL